MSIVNVVKVVALCLLVLLEYGWRYFCSHYYNCIMIVVMVVVIAVGVVALMVVLLLLV